MQEGITEKEVYRRQLLERYCEWLSRIERVNRSEVEAVGREMAFLLPPEDCALHGQVLAKIVQLHEEVSAMRRKSEYMKILRDFSQSIAMTFDESQILWKAFELVSKIMRADAFFIAFWNEGDSEIRVPISVDGGVNYGPFSLPFGQGLISRVIQTGQTIHIQTIEQVKSSFELICWDSPSPNCKTCIFVPLMVGQQVIGAISAQSYQEYAYSKEHEELLKIIGFKVSNAVATARIYERLYQMSFQDELTGLYNYRAFHRDLEALLQTESMVTLIMLDSDSLKSVNDLYGHHLGDSLIRRIAEAMKASAGPEDTTYRYAGDEFMLLSPNATVEEAMEKVGLIRAYLRQHPLMQENFCIPVEVSAGIASFPADAECADSLKRAADKALYMSKQKGKNCTTVYGLNISDCGG